MSARDQCFHMEAAMQDNQRAPASQSSPARLSDHPSSDRMSSDVNLAEQPHSGNGKAVSTYCLGQL